MVAAIRRGFIGLYPFGVILSNGLEYPNFFTGIYTFLPLHCKDFVIFFKLAVTQLEARQPIARAVHLVVRNSSPDDCPTNTLLVKQNGICGVFLEPPSISKENIVVEQDGCIVFFSFFPLCPDGEVGLPGRRTVGSAYPFVTFIFQEPRFLGSPHGVRKGLVKIRFIRIDVIDQQEISLPTRHTVALPPGVLEGLFGCLPSDLQFLSQSRYRH